MSGWATFYSRRRVSHIWFVKGTPSRIGLLLDVTPRLLEQVLYFAKYIITDITDTQRQRLVAPDPGRRRIAASTPARAIGRAASKRPQALLMSKLARTEDDKTQRLRDLEEERDRMVNWVGETCV